MAGAGKEELPTQGNDNKLVKKGWLQRRQCKENKAKKRNKVKVW